MTAARTYNQLHLPRNHNGHRRISIYWTWSYPWEAQRDPAAMEGQGAKSGEALIEVGKAHGERILLRSPVRVR